MAAHNILKQFAEDYADSLDNDPEFQSIEALNGWIADIAGLIEAPIAASDQIPFEGGNRPVPPLKSYEGNLFGPVIGEGRQMYASGSGMDCAIHSFLTSVSSNFRRINVSARNRIASHFRRAIMPRLSDVQREIARQMRIGGNHIVDDLEQDFLSDDMGAVLATRFKIGILVIKKTYPFSFHFANEFKKDENGEEIYERNGNGQIIQHRVKAVNSRTGQVGYAMEPVKVPTDFQRVVVHHSTMGHWTPIRFGNTYFVSRDDVIRAREHFWRVSSVAENQYRGRDANNQNLASIAAAMNISINEARQLRDQTHNAEKAASAKVAVSAKPASTPVIAKVISNTPWVCPVCTYENKASAAECEMCGAKKPASPNAVTLKNKKTNTRKANAPLTKQQKVDGSIAKLKAIMARRKLAENTKRNKDLAAKVAESVPNLSRLSLNNKTRNNKTNANKKNADKAKELGLSVKNYYNLMALQLMHNTKK